MPSVPRQPTLDPIYYYFTQYNFQLILFMFYSSQGVVLDTQGPYTFAQWLIGYNRE